MRLANMKSAILAIVASIVVTGAALAQDLGPRVKKLADGVYVHTGKGFDSNSGIILTDEGVVAVQAGPWSPVEISLHAKVLRTLATAFPYVVSYPCNAAVYGRPLGFAMASRTPIVERLQPKRTAGLIPKPLLRGLRYITPEVAHGIVQMPPFVTTAIESSDTIYTDQTPPQTAHAAGWEAATR